MRSKLFTLIIGINTCSLIWIVLLTNRIQAACVSIGGVGQNELTKISWRLAMIPSGASLKQAMIGIHSKMGGVLILALFMLLVSWGGMIYLMAASKPHV